MVTPCRLVALLEEAPGTGGMTITSATRARSPRVATSSRRYNNPLARLAIGATQGLMAKLHPSPAFTTFPRLILGRRSMMAVTRSASSRQGERPIPKGTTMRMTTNASPPSPPTSLGNPTQRILNQSGSPSMTASKTRANGFDATPLPLRSQGDPNPPMHCTFR
jgi:hypothetical protein